MHLFVYIYVYVYVYVSFCIFVSRSVSVFEKRLRVCRQNAHMLDHKTASWIIVALLDEMKGLRRWRRYSSCIRQESMEDPALDGTCKYSQLHMSARQHKTSRLQPTHTRVGALPQSHAGLCGTLVVPGKDTHGTPVPLRRKAVGGRTQAPRHDRRPKTTRQTRSQDKRAFRKQVLAYTWKLTELAFWERETAADNRKRGCVLGGEGDRESTRRRQFLDHE